MPAHFLALPAALAIPANAQIPLSMLLVFVSAKLLAEIFERVGLPDIVGQILAGVLLGPRVLNWMAPNEVLLVLSDLGVMFLLFRVGLEVKSSEMMKVGGRALLVASSGVVLPFAMGWGISLLFGQPRMESIFIGAAMVATSVGITAQVLASKRLLNTRAARLILAAAVIDDVLGLIVLAFISGLARSSVNYLDLALTAILTLAFTFFVARFGSRTAMRLIPRVHASLQLAEGEFALAMTLLFGLSLLAVYAGIAAIVGAFLAGMALSETVDRRVSDLTDGVAELMIPFFLFYIGMQFDVSAFTGGPILALAGAILAAALISKFLACGTAAWSLGRRDAIRVGIGMIPRGEVGVIVAQIGLRMGVMSPAAYAIIVFMSVATTLIAPPLLKLAFRPDKMASRD